MFEKTYKLEAGPPAVDFNEYANATSAAFLRLLDTAQTECQLQEFLELHPSMVPGALTPGSQSGHSPMYEALIAQPLLPGFDAKVPDFLWLSQHSSCIYAAMIEIECPTKKLFTKAGLQRAEFTQAYGQIKDWRRWFNSGSNKQIFFEQYGLTQRMMFSKEFELHFILVYGRRSEFVDNPNFSKRRHTLMSGHNEELMSFDRLQPNPWLSSAVTVKAIGAAQFLIKHVPETFEIRPPAVGDLFHFEGMEEAINRNQAMPAERRDFLLRRLPYWRSWKESGASRKTMYSTGDHE